MLKKGEREDLGITLHTIEDDAYVKRCQKKCGAGQELAPVPILLKIVSLSLSAILVNCRSQHVSGLGRKALKAMLFYLMWVPILHQNRITLQAYLIASMLIHL